MESHIYSMDEWSHAWDSNPASIMPVQRKDDRRLPGIITGWCVEFSEKYFAWRVWDGTVQREDHPTKDCIWGYWDSGCEIQYVEASSAFCIVYPKDKPEEEFVEWANEMAAIYRHGTEHP